MHSNITSHGCNVPINVSDSCNVNAFVFVYLFLTGLISILICMFMMFNLFPPLPEQSSFLYRLSQRVLNQSRCLFVLFVSTEIFCTIILSLIISFVCLIPFLVFMFGLLILGILMLIFDICCSLRQFIIWIFACDDLQETSFLTIPFLQPFITSFFERFRQFMNSNPANRFNTTIPPNRSENDHYQILT